MEAKLSQTQARALVEVGALENPEVVQSAQEQILQAENASQVEAIQAVAVELNVSSVMKVVIEAINKKQKVYVRYRSNPENPVETYFCAPLDIKAGETPGSKANDYLWVYSYKHGCVISLLLGRVLGVEISDEMFNPIDLMSDWKDKPEWNIEREW
jgi:hypothetical protein